MRRPTLLTFTAALLASRALAAPSFEAAPADVEFSYSKQAFQPWTFDTGWLPPTGEIQVRFIGHVGGGMWASAPGAIHLGWEPWQLSASSDVDAGLLAMDMGVELETFLRLDITLPAGQPFAWEGEIPFVPGFDYRFAGQQPYTPFLLEGQEPAMALVSDTIQETELFEIPLTSAIIPIPGIEGTLDVSAAGALDLALRHGRLVFPEGALTSISAPLVLAPHERAVHETAVQYEAEATYSAALQLEAAVTLHLAFFDWQLASFPIPVSLPPVSETWAFDEGRASPLRFELPGPADAGVNPPDAGTQGGGGTWSPPDELPVDELPGFGCATTPAAPLAALAMLAVLLAMQRRRIGTH